MKPRIETLSPKKLVGKRLAMSFADNQTFRLWQSFMPGRKEIKNTLNSELISMQVYPQSFDFSYPDINAGFDKWAAVEVADFDSVPDEMGTYILPGGLYAVFKYKGLSSDFKIYRYIFGTWLPGSEYSIDNRPHFEILGEKFKVDDPSSEEEIWIPIGPKS